MPSSSDIQIFSPSRQVAFHQLLVAARKTWLADALSGSLKRVDPDIVKKQVARFAPKDARKILAAAGIRDEFVFPTPAILEAQPALVGYYRLLLGISQKAFYRSGTGMSGFKSMEAAGALSDAQRKGLPGFCSAMGQALGSLVRQLSPQVTQRDVTELPLLTLGAQFQGGNNVNIGKQATSEAFLAIVEILKPYVTEHTARKLIVTNASNRKVHVAMAADPDLRIEEEFGKALHKKVAVEIKGGTDMSNVHNRAGEAEKSHQKAKAEGFIDFWTIILTKGVSLDKLRSESPTTNAWFDAAQVLGREGADWQRFCGRVAEAVGVPVIAPAP